jgi:hypothetical protein
MTSNHLLSPFPFLTLRLTSFHPSYTTYRFPKLINTLMGSWMPKKR